MRTPAVVAVLSLLGLAAPAWAQEPPPPLSFSATTPLAVDCAAMKAPAGVAVEIRNDSAASETIRLHFGHLTSPSGAHLPAAQVCGGLTITPTAIDEKGDEYPQVVIPAGETGLVKLHAGTAPATATTYSGSLAAFVTGAPVVRLALTVAAMPAGTVAPTPLVDSVTHTFYRGQPCGDGDTFWIPVKVKPTETVALAKDQLLGGVSGSHGSAAVVYANETKKLNDAASLIKLRLDGVDGVVGSFDGKIDLLPSDDKAGVVTLKLTRKDWWLYPALALLGGIAIALIGQRLAGVTVARHRLRARLADTGPRYAAARRRLTAAAGGQPWASFTISDLKSRRDELKSQIESDGQSAYIEIKPTKVDALIAKLDALEKGIDQIDAVDKHAKALALALTELRDNPPPNLPARNGSDAQLAEPALAAKVRPLLTGGPLPLDELTQRLSDFDTAAKAVTDLRAIETLISSYNDQLDELERQLHEPAPRERLQTARHQLETGWHKLWTASDKAQLDRLGANGDIDAAGRTVGELWPLLEGAEERRKLVYGGGGEEELPPAVTFGLEREGTEPISYTASGVQDELRAARTGQRVAIALALVAALVGGLTGLYIGKPFGSVWDYVLALTWGLTTQTVLTALAAALDGLGGLSAVDRHLRAPTPPAKVTA